MSNLASNFISIIANSTVIKDNFLRESDARGKIIMERIIRIRDIDEFFLFRLDPDKLDYFPFFSKIKNLKSVCDYFMFVERDNRQYLLIIELKSSSTSSQTASIQLNASKVFAKFLVETASRMRLSIGNPELVKVRIVGGKPTTSARQPGYEKGTDYITYRYPCFFDIKQVLDVYDQNKS